MEGGISCRYVSGSYKKFKEVVPAPGAIWDAGGRGRGDMHRCQRLVGAGIQFGVE